MVKVVAAVAGIAACNIILFLIALQVMEALLVPLVN